jgi:hypothetical protein
MGPDDSWRKIPRALEPPSSPNAGGSPRVILKIDFNRLSQLHDNTFLGAAIACTSDNERSPIPFAEVVASLVLAQFR